MKVNHNIRSKNGGTIYLVPDPDFVNLALPDVHTADTAQKYDIATKYEFNGRTYFYARAAGIVGGNLGVMPYNHQDVGYSVAAATSAVGATDISVTTDVNDNLAGVAVKDELKGGTCVIFEKTLGVLYEQIFGILGNDALASYGTLKIYLDAPLTQAFTIAVAYAEAIASPWAKVVASGGTVLSQGLCSCCGIPACHATSGQWLWVQTWGPCWASPAAVLGVGENNRDARWAGNASLSDGDATGTTVISQRAGWVMANDHANGQGAPFVYLQIAK